jgi:hypothetical protein
MSKRIRSSTKPHLPIPSHNPNNINCYPIVSLIAYLLPHYKYSLIIQVQNTCKRGSKKRMGRSRIYQYCSFCIIKRDRAFNYSRGISILPVKRDYSGSHQYVSFSRPSSSTLHLIPTSDCWPSFTIVSLRCSLVTSPDSLITSSCSWVSLTYSWVSSLRLKLL